MSPRQCRLLAGIAALFIAACGPSRLSQQDLSRQLASPDNRLQPDIAIYHTPDSSLLYFSLRTSELLFVKIEDTVRASLKVRYQLHASFEAAALLDSASLHFTVYPDSLGDLLKTHMTFRMPQEGKGVIRVFVSDEFRKKESEWIYEVNRTPAMLQQQFLLSDSSGIPLVRNFVRPGEFFYITSQMFGNSSLLVRCYFRTFNIPAPPFSKTPDPVFSLRQDSLFSYRTGDALRLESPGIYHFQADTSLKTGFTVFVFDTWFPEIKSPDQLIEPLRYLTMRKEYEELLKKPDPKVAAEEFWLKTGGINDRSKALIRIYYQRVQEANRRFTSYLPGWKTDRGMIYTIFGPPATVYRTESLEQWIYSLDSGGSVTFDFKRKGNPFTGNDFSLQRREEFDYPWYQSVERWRQGNISLR